ncbi:MAG: hypothetical protein KBA95_15995 [Acidobacteria bacterium]|nr:hypothetical protein [Acidobacteriota bacterium]
MSGRARDRRGYTDAGAAGALGVDERTVRRWRNRGWVVNGPDGHLDVRATLARVAADRDPTLGGKPDRMAGGATPVSGDGARLLKARAMRETLQAKLLQMAVEREEGRMIDRATAERVYFDIFHEAKTRLEALPERVAPSLVGQTDVRVIRGILRDEVEATLLGIASIPVVEG